MSFSIAAGRYSEYEAGGSQAAAVRVAVVNIALTARGLPLYVSCCDACCTLTSVADAWSRCGSSSGQLTQVISM